MRRVCRRFLGGRVVLLGTARGCSLFAEGCATTPDGDQVSEECRERLGARYGLTPEAEFDCAVGDVDVVDGEPTDCRGSLSI